MIFRFFIDAIFTLFSRFLEYFPDANIQNRDLIINGIYNMKTLIVNFNWIFPVDTLIWLLDGAVVITYALGLFLIAKSIVGLVK